ncbi:MAG: hypothetical protein Q8M35_03465, partial [Pseudohongiella sp.]|nr:hypothetical protein [Pseudohongiella sp.]
ALEDQQNSLILKREINGIVIGLPEDEFVATPEIQVSGNDDLISLPIESSDQCFMLGPFESEQRLIDLFGGFEFEVLVRRVEDSNRPFYRAFTLASKSRAEALGVLSVIRDAIERSGSQIDSYIVSSGLLENAISLGLFSEQVNALNVQRILGAQGVNVFVEPELRLLDQYWVVAKTAYYFDFKRKIDEAPEVSSQEISATENLCETIAQAE